MATLRVRQLRSHAAEGEKRLWSKLRLKQIGGHRFRRQVAIGPYIVDFICLARRLIIEVDGGQHDSRATQDDARTALLERERFPVLRVLDHDVLRHIEGGYEV